MPSASSFNCAPDAISTPSVCWVQSSPDWHAGHGDAPVGPTMKGSPRPRFASDTATGAPRSRTFRVREGVSYFDLKNGPAVDEGWLGGASGRDPVWALGCGSVSWCKGTDLDQVVGENAVSAPGSGAADAGEFGAVPAVASFDVVDPSFG